jgi:hypothetical protein
VRAALGYPFLLQADFGLGSMGFFVKHEQPISSGGRGFVRDCMPPSFLSASPRIRVGSAPNSDWPNGLSEQTCCTLGATVLQKMKQCDFAN